MRPPNAIEDFYWQEFGAALRAMLGLAVVLAAVGAAALTLTGASRPVERHPGAVHDCQRCASHLPDLSV